MDNIVEKYVKLARKYNISLGDANRNVGEYIKEALCEFLKGKKNVAIFGAGKHTEQLLVDYVSQLREVKIFIDNFKKSDISTGYKIIKDCEIENEKIDGVIISSFDYKEEMKRTMLEEHPSVPFLDFYKFLEEKGIYLCADFYRKTSPYAHYIKINKLQTNIKNGYKVDLSYYDLISELFLIKDFLTAKNTAISFSNTSTDRRAQDLKNDLIEFYDSYIDEFKNISPDVVLVLVLDAMKKEALTDNDNAKLKKMTRYLYDNTYSFEKAYSCSTFTFESLVPAFSECFDQRTEYFLHDDVPCEKCRMAQEAIKQNRNIYIIGDSFDYISGEGIWHSGTQQTATEKMWEFLIHAREDSTGFFYLHELYESHFSYPNPYIEGEIIADGTNELFEYTELKGGKPRADYNYQYKCAMNYIDDIYTPIVSELSCRMIVMADHGCFNIDKDATLNDVSFESLVAGDELIRIPFFVKSPEMGVGKTEELFSLMSINDVVISLLRKERYSVSSREYIKIGRSEIYNPDFGFILRGLGYEKALLAFEGYIFKDGYKLIVYSNGEKDLYDRFDKICFDGELTNSYFYIIENEMSIL